MHSVMSQLHDDHHNVARILDYIRRQVALADDGGDPDYERLHEVMHYLTNYPDVFHHPREDLVFARLMKREESARLTIERLKREHVELGAQGATLRNRLQQKSTGRRLQKKRLMRELAEYADFLQEHMEIEERKVFPLAKLLLTDDDWEGVAKSIRLREDPLFGGDATRPYAALLNALERHPH